MVTVDEDGFADLCGYLYEQAKTAMQDHMSQILDTIKEGKEDVLWQDEKQNSVRLSFLKGKDGDPRRIFWGIYASKNK